MSYVTGPKRIVRNPITGEELHYTRGTKDPNEPAPKPVAQEHNARVNELVTKPNNSNFVSSFDTFTKQQQNRLPLSRPASAYSNIGSSQLANASVPVMDFGDLSANRITDYTKDDEVYDDDNNLVDNTSILSPILSYQNRINKMVNIKSTPPTTTIPSQIDAPRNVNNQENPHLRFDLLLDSLEQPAVKKKDSIYKVERVADLEKLWLNVNPHDSQAGGSFESKLEKEHQMRESLVFDQVLANELSTLSSTTNNNNNNNPGFIYTSRGNRIPSTPRNNILPNVSLSENMLSKRCKFNCRMKTSDGKLACRELFGILFLHDGSLTIYEFRMLCSATFTGSSNMSKKANALPFLNRKVYKHAFGRRKGLNVEIWDIFNGATVYLECSNKASLPGSLKDAEFLELEISEVNEVEKEQFLISTETQNPQLTPNEITQNITLIKKKLANPLSDIEANDRKIVNSVRKFMCKQIENRSVEVYMGLSKYLKQQKKSKNPLLSQQEFHDALIKYGIQIHSEDITIVWNVLDLNASGVLSYYKLMRSYFGEMNNHRFAVFRSLMNKLDTQKIGYVQLSALDKFFRASRHPKVRAGELSESEMMQQFLNQFDLLNPIKCTDFNEISTSTDTKTPLIAYDQFEEYYNGLSIQIESDNDFIQILKNSWNLV
jgi:calcyphosin